MTPGTFVDLTYINKKKPEVAPMASKKSIIQSIIETEVDAGTSYIFQKVGNEFKKARRIPVAFA